MGQCKAAQNVSAGLTKTRVLDGFPGHYTVMVVPNVTIRCSPKEGDKLKKEKVIEILIIIVKIIVIIIPNKK